MTINNCELFTVFIHVNKYALCIHKIKVTIASYTMSCQNIVNNPMHADSAKCTQLTFAL